MTLSRSARGWGVLLIVLTFIASSVLQLAGVRPAFAGTYTDSYQWPSAPCADSGSVLGQTSGTGYWCSGYNWGESPCPSGDGYCSSGNELNGYYLYDKYGYGFRNCTSYVASEINKQFGVNISGWGNGADWDTGALNAKYTNDSSPQAGDIAQWNATTSNPWGHVAYVYKVTNGVASYAEYNYGEDGNYTDTYTSASSSQGAPDHWIHIGTLSSGGGSTVPRVTPLQYNTEMDIFKRGSDNAIWKDTIQAGSNSWGGWNSLGGILASNPAADQYGSGEMDVFATNSVGALCQITYQSSTNSWGGWTLRANNMAGDPTSIAYNGNLYVFSRGTDGNLYVMYWNGSSWIGPNRIAGNGSTAMGSSPTVVIYGTEMDVFMRGVDSNLWKSGTTDGVNFGSLGITANVGNLENDPKAITYDGEMDVYANTTSGTLVHDTYTTTNGWSGFNPLLGVSFVGSPTALQYGSGEMDVYDRGMSDSYIYKNTWEAGGTSWSGWNSLGGNEQGDPTVLEWTPDSEMDVYATNYSNNTDKNTWQPSLDSWSGFQSLL